MDIRIVQETHDLVMKKHLLKYIRYPASCEFKPGSGSVVK